VASFVDTWVIRRIDPDSFDPFSERGKAHYVESEITDRLVMRCGRQLRLTTERGTLAAFVARSLERRRQQCT
jgi:hypothetical protein